MRYGEDGRQMELVVDGTRRRGRPSSVDGAATSAERQAARRRRLSEQGKGTLTVPVSQEVIDALDRFVRFKDVTKGEVVDRILRGTLLRKR